MPSDQRAQGYLAPQLPYLRRYARVLAGSQTRGDAFVRAALEATLDSDLNPDLHLPAKLLLFMVFHRFWNPHRDSVQDNHAPLTDLPPIGREALLLTAVEGFSNAETSAILGISESETEDAIARTKAAIARAIQSDVLIIEDEPIIAMHLEQLVTDMGHRVTGIAATHDAAVRLAQSSPPDLVLSDIQLADGSSGIEAVAEIGAAFPVPVVFVTAYPERLLTGTRPEPVYLVSKPFDANAIYATVGQALLQRETSLSPTAC